MGWSHGGLATSDSTTAALNAVPIKPSAPFPAPGAGHVLPLWYQHFCKSRNRRRQGWPLHFQPSRPGQYLRVSHLRLFGHLSKLLSCGNSLVVSTSKCVRRIRCCIYYRMNGQLYMQFYILAQFFSTLNVEIFLRVVLRLVPIASMVNMIGLVVGVVPE